MLHNIALGSGLIATSVLIHTIGLILIATFIPHFSHSLGLHNHDVGRTLVMMVSVLGIIALLTVEIWIWAAAYAMIKVVSGFADALFLSTALFSTIGYGELAFDPGWRLLTAFEGINGFILIGWSTAFLIGVSTRHGPFSRNEHF